MKRFSNDQGRYPIPPDFTRRRFVQGLAAGGILTALGLGPSALRAASAANAGPRTLRGTSFDLHIRHQPVNFTGTPAVATAVNGSVPAPILRWREGDEVTLRVTNHLPVSSSIHWHGMVLPEPMDGVPGISFDGIAPGETFIYRFPVRQSGTFWYHSHTGFQEQTGLYGAIVIDPQGPDPLACDRDHVVVLSDWTDEDPATVYAKLKKLSDYYNRHERTFGDLLREVEQQGVAATWRARAMWDRMRMSDRDLSDVTGYTYTFLMNGQAPANGWVGLFRPGERVRLRFVNASSMTFFDLRIPGLKMTVVAADGNPVEPVTVDEIRMGVAETFDVVVEPAGDRAYTLFAQAIDRSGYARGTLTPDPSLRAPVPAPDPLPILTHTDMGMDMSHMDMAGMDMSHMGHRGHDMAGRSGMQHGAQPMAMAGKPGPGHAMGSGPAGLGSAAPVMHAASEYGPQVDMRAEAPCYRLDDPGVGLRGNGRRVLTYADLRHRHGTPDPREPGREIQLHLTGNMNRYMWSFDGIKFADAEPLALHFGERVRITLVNDTMMNHPIHLHGMWSDLETGDPGHIPRKHTVVAQPGAKISYLVTADAMGAWAYHCHLLYHMLGMFRKVVVS